MGPISSTSRKGSTSSRPSVGTGRRTMNPPPSIWRWAVTMRVILRVMHLCCTRLIYVAEHVAEAHMTIVIEPKVKDIGGFSVRRSLPSAQMRMVGPWAFFDHFGPTTIAAGVNSDVRPHPHIGLATVTTLFDG